MLDPAAYAALVRNASDDELADGLRENRALSSTACSPAWPSHLDPDRRATPRPSSSGTSLAARTAAMTSFQIVIRRGTCA